MQQLAQKPDIILINLDSWFPSNSALAILDPYLKQRGLNSLVISGSQLDHYLDQADVFGISVMDHSYFTAQQLTQKLRDKTVIWGGWTSTAIPEFILQENPDVDYVILQEGEKRLVTLLQSFKQPELFDSLDGIAYRNGNNSITVRPPLTFIDLNELPIPNDLTIFNGTVFVELARGCYGRCRYCQEVFKMRFKNAENIVHEIRHWYEKGHKSFYFGGGNSLANGPLLRKCIEELEAQEFSINICLVGRPEDVLRHDDVLEYIFQNPTIRPYVIELGIEADTQHLLDLLGRKVTPEINRKAVQSLLALRAKYSPRTKILANMILFSHYDMTIEDFIANVRFIGEHQCSQEVMTLSLCGFANTPIWQDMRNRGFRPQPLKGLQIFDYLFSDDIVNKLFKKFSHHLYEQLTKKKTSASFWDYKTVQKQMYDKIMDFYASDDIMKRIMTFLESADFTG